MSETRQPRFEDTGPIHITGRSETYTGEAAATGIPAQWQEFLPHLARIPDQKSGVTFGVCMMTPDAMTYIAGVETEPGAAPPDGLTHIQLEPQRYAVFAHEGPLSDIRHSWAAITDWFSSSDTARANAPEFERYSADFEPMSGKGYVEIWVPVET